MRLYDIFKLSLRMFRARTMRTILTILGMGLGIAAILFFVSLGYGLQRTLLEKITTADALVTLDVSPAGDAVLTTEIIGELGKIPGVVETASAVRNRGQAHVGSITLDVDTTGTTESFLRLDGTKALHGTILNDNAPDTVVITRGVAQAFNASPESMVGQPLSLALFASSDAARIGEKKSQDKASEESIGTITTTIAGVIDGDENIVYFHLQALPDGRFSSFNQLKLKTQSADVMEQVREAVIARHFSVSSLSDTVAQANKVFGAIQITLMFFGMIALGVSAIGMFNTMTIALLERTEEIGIMKSIGASRGSIALMFVVESTMMGLLGSLCGVVMSYTGGKLINSIVNVIAERFGGQSASLFYSPLWFVGLVILFGAFVGFLTGLFPARQASRIDPLDALRYK